MTWRVLLTCCGRDGGYIDTETWEQADAAREAYICGPGCDPHGYSGDPYSGGHKRSGRIVVVGAAAAAGERKEGGRG